MRMEIRISSTTPLRYTMVITEDERFKLATALCHARRYEKMMEYGDDWTKRIEAMQELLDQYDEDDEED
jgi:hypothetical protein